VDEAASRIRDEVQDEADIVVGAIFDRNLDGKFRVSVVATGLDGVAAGTQARPSVALGQDIHTPTLQ
jgi:cell division protein FtsZ